MIGRRALLATGAALGLAPFASVAQTAGTPAPHSSDDRIRAAARNSRKRLAFTGGRFAGDGYDWLRDQGREARFFCLGEEHGIAENPRLAAQLFEDLAPAGYSRVAIEISPPMASELDAALERGGFEALHRLLTSEGRTVAFYGMREEAEWLAAAKRAGASIWGTDYDIAADRHLIGVLKPMPKPAAAETALARLAAASAASWAKYAETRNLLEAFGFAGDPVLAHALRAAWPRPSAEAAAIIDTLVETLEINRLWVSGDVQASNVRRAANLRENLLRRWRPYATAERAPKLFLKYGSNHLVRGLTGVGTFDTGSLVAELAALRGERSFHLLVLPGKSSPVAVFDPTTLKYRPDSPKDGYATGLERVTDEAWPDVPTLFVTEPLRRLVMSRRHQADPELARTVMGYDAILILSGSTASHNL
jgi:hypothetical protein